MILDSSIERWCLDAYSPEEEALYWDYAEYVTVEPWLKGLRRHGLLLLAALAALAAIGFVGYQRMELPAMEFWEVMATLLAFVSLATPTFMAYGYKRYNMLDGTTPLFYVMLLYVLCWSVSNMGFVVKAAVIVLCAPLAIYMHCVYPIKFHALKKRAKQFRALRLQEDEMAQREKDLQTLEAWHRNHDPQHQAERQRSYDWVPERPIPVDMVAAPEPEPPLQIQVPLSYDEDHEDDCDDLQREPDNI